jgi:hypothetical protein
VPTELANVGPGAYNPKPGYGKKKEPKWGFGTSSRGLGYSESQPNLKTNSDLSSNKVSINLGAWFMIGKFCDKDLG